MGEVVPPIPPYYEHDGVTIYHGDCLEVMRDIDPIVDLVVTSPPYNLGMHPTGKGSGMHAGSGYTANGKVWNRVADLAGGYGDHDDAMPQDEYDAWQTEVVRACWGALLPNGAIFYNHKPRPMNGTLHLPLIYGADLPLRQIITWDRNVGMNFAETHFLPKYEWIVVWAKPAWRLANRQASAFSDVWRVRPEDNTDHPAPFPLGIPARAIAASGPSVVLDPFMGSGTTLRAAKDAGVRAIGIDNNEAYCEIAANRLAAGGSSPMNGEVVPPILSAERVAFTVRVAGEFPAVRDLAASHEALRARLVGCHEKQAKVWAAMEAAEARVVALTAALNDPSIELLIAMAETQHDDEYEDEYDEKHLIKVARQMLRAVARAVLAGDPPQ